MSAPYRNFKNASVDSDIAVNCEARRERVVVLVGVVFFAQGKFLGVLDDD